MSILIIEIIYYLYINILIILLEMSKRHLFVLDQLQLFNKIIDFLSGKTATDRERSETRAVDQQPSCHRSTKVALRERKRVIDKLLSLDESH